MYCTQKHTDRETGFKMKAELKNQARSQSEDSADMNKRGMRISTLEIQKYPKGFLQRPMKAKRPSLSMARWVRRYRGR